MIRRYLIAGLFSASPAGMREAPYRGVATAREGQLR